MAKVTCWKLPWVISYISVILEGIYRIFCFSFFFPGFTCQSIVVYHSTFIFLSIFNFLWRWADSIYVRITLSPCCLHHLWFICMYASVEWQRCVTTTNKTSDAKVYMFLDQNFTLRHWCVWFGDRKPWWIQNHGEIITKTTISCFIKSRQIQLSLLPNMHYV